MTEQLFVGFHHFALRSPNLQRSITFFEALGFRQVHSWRLPEYSIDRAVMMQAGDSKSWIEIFDLKAGIPMQGRATRGPNTMLDANACFTVASRSASTLASCLLRALCQRSLHARRSMLHTNA